MRVICVVPEYPPDLPPHGLGGVTTYFLNMSLGYVANGAEVTILTSAHGVSIGTQELGPNGESVERVFGHRSRYSRSPLGRLVYELQREFRLALATWRWRKDTVLIELPDWQTPLLPGLLVGRSKTYMKLHGPSDFVRRINGQSPSRVWALIDFREKFWASWVRVLEAGSVVLIEHARVSWGLTRSITLTPDPIDLGGPSHAADLPPAHSAMLPAPAGCVRIVDVGRLEFRKGQHIVCESLSELGEIREQWHLHFIGPDTNTAPDGGSYRAFCQGLIPDRLRERVSWDPPVSLAGLGRVYETADIVLISSMDGNYGYTTLQPLAAGACVITTLEPGQLTSQYAEHGESALLYRSDSPAALARLLKRAIDDPDLRSHLRQGAAERAATTLSPALHTRRLLHKFGIEGNAAK